MRQDNYPHPVSDPEADGIPGYADDDSMADSDPGRIADGPDPAALPGDRPVAVDRFGITAEEEAEATPRDPADEGDALSEQVDQLNGDAAAVMNIAPIQPNADSPVSMYDVPGELGDPGAPVGRLVEPDEGVREDDEKDLVAYDAGEAGGGPTAEEAAMHEVREP
jgi:hypothetical protein